MASFVNLGVNPATRALEIFTDVVETLTSFLPGNEAAKKRRETAEFARQEPKTRMVWAGTKMVQEGSQEHQDFLAGKTGGMETPGANVGGSTGAKALAEKYFGKAISDSEFSALIKATHAEAAGGKQASQQEQAMIMASILNRARTDPGGVMGALTAKNQFQSVTGTSANQNQPSQHYLQGPSGERLASIEGASALLANISTKQRDFTAASSAAYGPGTNIDYRNKMLAEGGQTIGGSVFRTSMGAGPNNTNPTASVSGHTNAYSAKNLAQQSVDNLVNTTATKPLATTTNPQQAPDSVLVAQLGKMEEMLSVMKNQFFATEKLVRMQS
jgi:hypothetical protein